MATKAEIVVLARNYLRDFPIFFQTERDKTGRTYKLGHINVDTTGLWVATVAAGVPTEIAAADYSLRERDGILRFANTVDLSAVDSIMVEGDHYEWVTPDDLDFYADVAITATMHNLNQTLNNVAPVIGNVIGMQAVIQVLWGLMTEYARDVDVIASESVHIPASQRYRMVKDLLAYWEKEYQKLAQGLNIGLDRLEVFNLRRRSKTTNRFVPIYKEREIGDYGPLERLWPEIDNGKIELEDNDDLREDVHLDGDPPEGYTSSTYQGGYGSIYY